MKNIVQLTEEYALKILENDLPPNLHYHDVDHTMSVRETALKLGTHYEIGEANMEAMEIAALLHDTGYIKAYTGHEKVSAELAVTFLSSHNYPEEQIALVVELIDATKLVYEPKNLLQQIIKDSDLNNLGQGKYMKTIANLRHEMKVFLGQEYEDAGFMEMNLGFMDGHSYFTEKASELFDKKKAKNRKKVVKALDTIIAESKEKKKKKEKKEDTMKKEDTIKKEKKKAKENLADSINSNKSAQMMFKTSLRNHIDLTSIADNKANIMLTINAGIITVSLSLLAPVISANPTMIYPISILLITCVATIIYATITTRPIKAKGTTPIKNINEGSTNLFFYGNFYKMDINQYKEGIKVILDDEKKLDDTIISDLFYLGKALGRKFEQLRTCYLIFMVGMTLTVIAFAIISILQL